MKKQSTSTLIYGLLLAQLILSFVLGIFGNKLSELIALSPTTLLSATIFLITISFVITVILLRQEKEPETSKNTGTSILSNSLRYVFSRIATVVPFSIVYGAIIGYLCTKFVPGLDRWDLIIWQGTGPWLYEIVGYIIGLISLYALNTYKQDRAIILTFAIGYAIGAATSVIMLEPDGNSAIITFPSWIFFMIIGTVLPRTLRGFVEDLQGVMGNVTEQRK